MFVESPEFVAIVSCPDSVVCCCKSVVIGVMIVGGTVDVVGSVVGDICLEVVFFLVVFVGMMFDGCAVFDNVGVMAIVNAGDVGCGLLRAISKLGYQYCLAKTYGPLLITLVSVRLAAGHCRSTLLIV